MRKALGLRWVVVAVGAVMLLVLAVACAREVVKEVPVEKVVTKEVVKEVQIPGETVVVEKEVQVPGETVVVTKEVVKEVQVPGETVVVTKEVVKEVQVPGETVVVTKEVVKEVEVPGETVVVEKIVEKIVLATPIPGLAPEPKDRPGTVTLIGGVGGEAGIPALGGGNDTSYAWDFTETPFRVEGDDFGAAGLVISWDLKDDLSGVTMDVRQGVQFHKGWGELTAADMVWSINSVNAVTTPTSTHSNAGDFASSFLEAELIDTHRWWLPFSRYDVTWKNNLLSNWGASYGTLSKKHNDDLGDDGKFELIGSGPFQIQEWRTDDFMILERVPYDHWRVNPVVQQVRIVTVPESATQVAVLLTGEVSGAKVSPKDAIRVKDRGFALKDYGGFNVGLLFEGNFWATHHANTGEALEPWNAETFKEDHPWVGNPFGGEPYADSVTGLTVSEGGTLPYTDTDNPPGVDDMEQARLVRLAMSVSVDRALINETIFGGLGAVRSNYFVHEVSPYFQGRWSVPYDPELAEQLLDQAGYPRGDDGWRFEIPYFVSPWMSEPDEIGDAVTGFWNEVGMKTKLFSDSYAGVYRPMIVARTAYQPWLVTGYDGPLAPFDFPRGLLNTTLVHGGASFGAESELFDNLFKKASAEPDLQKRRDLMTEIIDYMHHWVLNPAIVFQPNLVAINPKQIASWDLYSDNQEKTFNNLSSLVPAR